MKLFIDTSNKKLILATIDYSNNVVDFSIQNTDNNMAKIAVDEISKFLKNQNSSINDITEYLFTTGPGSFTGVKVALNIISSISITKKIEKIHIIDSFKLIEQDKYIYTAIPFGKSKYYLKKNKSNKINVVNQTEIKEYTSVNYGYDLMNKELLQKKINAKNFKIVDNLDKVKIKYLSTF